jgi:phosphoribosylamine--glycine ligase
MRTLVVGSGAREHAIAWALSRSPDYGSAAASRERIFVAPGNAGSLELATNLSIDPESAPAIVAACRELGIGLVIVGPETALAGGLVDALAEAGIPAFGPPRAAARLESSKSFARAFSDSAGVPSARTARFGSVPELQRFLDELKGRRIVLKKSGLAAGKGVFESDDPAELASFGRAVLETDELLAEEFLVGSELSVFALCDGSDHLVLPACADHKKAGAGDSGANTGGMGAVCPVPLADAPLMAKIERQIVEPSFRAMERESLTYRGVLFFGIMNTAEGPRLLEYNVRFGDPETQSLLPLLDSNFLELCIGVAKGRLCSLRPSFSAKVACGVVVAAPGYPGSYPKGLGVEFGDGAADPNGIIFHASTIRDEEGALRTSGGRCFTAVGLGDSWQQARDRAYSRARSIRFEGAWFRPDIGAKVYAR